MTQSTLSIQGYKQLVEKQQTIINEQDIEIERLKKLLAARPTEMALFAATETADHYRDLFTKSDDARKTAERENERLQKKLRRERSYASFLEEKHLGDGVRS